MPDFSDPLGQTWADNGDETWTCGGLTWGPGEQAGAERFAAISFPPPPPPPPPAEAPRTVTNFQLRAALMAMPAPGGTMFDLVDAAVHAEGGVALQAWEYANDVDRTGPLVQQMATAFGFSEAQLDALFTTAAGISA